MDSKFLLYVAGGAAAVFAIIVFAYMALKKKMMGKNTRYIAQLTEGTKQNSFNMEIFYQKFYITVVKIPFLRRYAMKLRRRLEIINLEDEFLTRKQTAQILIKGLIILYLLIFNVEATTS